MLDATELGLQRYSYTHALGMETVSFTAAFNGFLIPLSRLPDR